MLKFVKILVIFAFFVFMAAGPMSAQITTGTILGTVRDSSGAVVAGAKIEIVNEDTGLSRTVEADSDGRYSAPSLSLGNYRVTASRDGFQTEVRTGIVLTVGREAVVDMALTVGAMTQSVEVTAEAPLVESTSATLSSLVDEQAIRELPLNGRSYDQLALLQPGVILGSIGVITSTSFQFGSGSRFSVGGQRSEANLFLLDGTDIDDQGNGTPGGAAGVNLGVDTIREFKIFTNSFKAEFGHSTGSVTTAITRSGTNSLHGTAFEYIRNSALDARNFFDVGSSPPPFRRNQFGGVLGGPIKKNKLFFFGGFEGLRQGLGTTLSATVPTALARQGILPTGTFPVSSTVVPYLNMYPLPSPNGTNFGDGTAQYLSAPTVITNETYFMGRVDYQLNSKTTVFGRYSFDGDSLNAPQSLPGNVQISTSRRQYATLQANSILGASALNNFRFAYNRTAPSFNQLILPDPGPSLDFIPGLPFGAISVGGGAGGGGVRAITQLGSVTGNGATVWEYNIFQWGDDFSYVKGKNSIKVGVDIERLRDNTYTGSQLRGSYTFNTFTGFLAGTPNTLQASFPLGVLPLFGLRQTLIGVYGQDDYRVNSRLTLNLGMRWEITTDPTDANGHMAILPSPAATSTVLSNSFFSTGKKNFEPRVGMAWEITGNGKLVLRAGAGIYHNQLLPWAFFIPVKIPPYFGTFSITNPAFPNAYQVLQAATLSSVALNVVTPTMKVPVSDQYNLSIQQQLSTTMVLELSYAGNHSNHLLTRSEADTPIPTICSTALANCPAGVPNGADYFPAGPSGGTSIAARRNTAWTGMTMYGTDANSDYNAATVSLRRQSPNGLQGQIFYTYSKAMDESSNANGAESTRAPSAVMEPDNLADDWGLSEYDARHAFHVDVLYPLPFRSDSKAMSALIGGWSIDGIGTVTSGQPFTARLSSAVSRNGATTLAERPNLNAGFSNNPTSGVSAGCTGFAPGTPVGTPVHWFDPCAFSLPITGTYGNLGRDTLIGPGVAEVDLAVVKSFKLAEKANMLFRAEVFNVMNHANFGLPNETPLSGTGTINGSAGAITYTTTSSRQVQFALRFEF